jgi:hypothetical protein
MVSGNESRAALQQAFDLGLPEYRVGSVKQRVEAANILEVQQNLNAIPQPLCRSCLDEWNTSMNRCRPWW